MKRRLDIKCQYEVRKNLPASDLAEKVSCGIGAGGGHANKAGGMLMKHMLATQYPGRCKRNSHSANP